MYIFVDESGSFAVSSHKGSWNVVAGLVVPEGSLGSLKRILSNLKSKIGVPDHQEVKIDKIDELTLSSFIMELGFSDCILLAVSTDTGFADDHQITNHKIGQVNRVMVNELRMKYPEGREMIIDVANKLSGVSNQLYIQLVCQIQLFSEILPVSVNYYAQRTPLTLGNFRWRIDQKNAVKNRYELSFENLICPLIQQKSLREPMEYFVGPDYSALFPYQYSKSDFPHFSEQIQERKVDGLLNIAKIFHSDLKFVDSKNCEGIQIVDILTSAIAKCMRAKFENNRLIALLLGKLIVQKPKGKLPIRLISIGDVGNIDRHAQSMIMLMMQTRKNMLTKNFVSA